MFRYLKGWNCMHASTTQRAATSAQPAIISAPNERNERKPTLKIVTDQTTYKESVTSKPSKYPIALEDTVSAINQHKLNIS